VLVLPRHRTRRGRGTVAAAAFDEDSITLAADAVLELLARTPATPAALLLATVSAPLAEGGAVQTVAELAGLAGVGLHVQEHGGTTSAAGAALVSAAALVRVGIAPVIVVASDVRRDAAGAPYGDGAVALLLDAEGRLGRIKHAGSAAEAFPDRWRHAEDAGVQVGDDSLLPYGAAPAHRSALAGDGEPTELITVNAPLLDRAGLLGCAALPAALLLGAEDSPSRTLIASAGGVTHALRFEPGPGLTGAASDARTVLAAGVDAAPAAVGPVGGFDPYASVPRAWRERQQDLRLEGVRCADCGEVLYPAPPCCPKDGLDAKLEPYRLQRTGTVLTRTRDHLFPLGAPITMCVVEVDGGGRFYGQAAGGQDVAIGERVRLVPRLLHRGGGRPQYFWKVQPVENAADASTRGV
jgi:uncharacterized OB-fold protein